MIDTTLEEMARLIPEPEECAMARREYQETAASEPAEPGAYAHCLLAQPNPEPQKG